MSLDSILVSYVASGSVPFTELHECVSPLSLFRYKNSLFTNILWKFVVRFWHCISVPNIVYISLSISELQKHPPSHCSLLWYTKVIVYQQIYQNNGVKSLNLTCLQRFVCVCIQVIELQELACPI